MRLRKLFVGALEAPRRPKADSWTTVSLHIIGESVIFVNFAVGTKRSPTVVGIIKAMAEDHFAWAVGGEDSIEHGEIVEPHNNEVQEMDQHDQSKSFVWEGT